MGREQREEAPVERAQHLGAPRVEIRHDDAEHRAGLGLESHAHRVRDRAQLGRVVGPRGAAGLDGLAVGDGEHLGAGADERGHDPALLGRRREKAREHERRGRLDRAGPDEPGDVVRQRGRVHQVVVVERLRVRVAPPLPRGLVVGEVVVARRQAVPRVAELPGAHRLARGAVDVEQDLVAARHERRPAPLGDERGEPGAGRRPRGERLVMTGDEPGRQRQDRRRLPPRVAGLDPAAREALGEVARQAPVDRDERGAGGARVERRVERHGASARQGQQRRGGVRVRHRGRGGGPDRPRSDGRVPRFEQVCDGVHGGRVYPLGPGRGEAARRMTGWKASLRRSRSTAERRSRDRGVGRDRTRPRPRVQCRRTPRRTTIPAPPPVRGSRGPARRARVSRLRDPRGRPTRTRRPAVRSSF